MTILFLDSQSTTRAERASALSRQLDWDVNAVATLAEARAWLAQTTTLDLLITEAIIDAQNSGFDLRDAALARFPEARVLFTTRYDLKGYEVSIAGWPVLQDAPFSVGKLMIKAQAALQSAAPAEVLKAEPPAFLAPGTMLGNYQVLERLTLENESETYRAIQVTVQRPVALVLMRPELLSQPDLVENFKARERLKASISHPRIAPLYEAGSVNGYLFYTRELPRGRSLDEILEAGETLSERQITELIYGVAEAMDYAVERGCNHRRLNEGDIFIDAENQASIVNVFRPGDSRTRDPKEEVAALMRMLAPLAAEGKARGLVASLVSETRDWTGILEALDEVRDDMRDRSIMRRIEKEDISPQGTRGAPWWLWAIAVAALFVVFGLGNFIGKVTPKTTAKSPITSQEMMVIPAGPFQYQKKERRNLPTFWISRDEVTISQYAEFLAALKKQPSVNVNHPDQPKTKMSHQPPKWAETYAAAKAGSTFNGQVMSLNTPVTQVDWWDAYAFAKWKNQRLPTEEEWEKAARGDKGLLFPWGDQPSKDKANLGDDYDANGVKGGTKDGYNLWASIDRQSADLSPYGIRDMAGNVSEWTASEFKGEAWPAHPDYPDLRVPVVRGGHFALKSNHDLLTARFFAESANETTLARGFRTVSDTAPAVRK